MRTPADHYEIADQILTNVEHEDGSMTWVKGELARAQVHALLAQYGGGHVINVHNSHPESTERVSVAAEVAK